MDLLIKGKEMPKTAFECSTKINPEERRCNFTGKVFEETLSLLTQRRCADCPLVEIPTPCTAMSGSAMNKQHYINMFLDEYRDHGADALYPFCVDVISVIVADTDRSPETTLANVRQALEALETVKEEI